jgi:signal transduction histidine kinase
LLPKALALPSPKELRRANEALTERVRERDSALVALARSNAEREKVEDMLRQSQKMEAIGQFTGGMAHDFNNLLGVVMGNLERLERRVEADRVSLSAVHNAQEASNRAATVVHKLLAFARKQPLLPSVIDVNTLVRDVLPLVQGIVGGSAISLDLAATQQICVDANQMESALLNLIVNARDAMPDSGTLTIRTKDLGAGDEDFADGLAPAEYVVVEIHDTGVGMSDEVRDRAFEPFFTTKSVGQGTGLGLSQVFGFVKQSGGNVRVFSQAGAGTCVALYIPSVTTDASSGQPAGQPVRDCAAGHV